MRRTVPIPNLQQDLKLSVGLTQNLLSVEHELRQTKQQIAALNKKVRQLESRARQLRQFIRVFYSPAVRIFAASKKSNKRFRRGASDGNES